jgi:glycosyltransferase involved in cell wall biosynthesis
MQDSGRARVPAISVLMTLYNREAFVADAIESVLAQTFENFELIVCDDRSTDNGVEIARSFAARDSRVKVFVNDTNLGDYPNRNRAARLATGMFIKYHDSDDIMYPHCLEMMVAPMLAEPSASLGMSLGKNFPGGPSPMLLTPRLSYQREFLGAGIFSGGPACAIIRREKFIELGLFPSRGVASDYVFWLKAGAVWNIVTLPADLFWWRMHPGQEFQKEGAELQYAIVHGEAWRALASPACPLGKDEIEQAKRTVVVGLLRAISNDLRRKRYKVARKRLSEAGISKADLYRYARSPGRRTLAGTPLDANGDYITPDWPSMLKAAAELSQARQSTEP